MSRSLAQDVFGDIDSAEGAVSSDPLALPRRILAARNPAALVELEEGLLVATRGETDLEAWLTRAVVAVELTGDELDTLREGLGFALGVARTAAAGGPQLRALGIVDRLGKSISVVKSRRPPEHRPDEVTARLVAVRDAAIERIGVLTSESAAKLTRDRAALLAGLDVGPATAAEIGRRVDAMLGGTP